VQDDASTGNETNRKQDKNMKSSNQLFLLSMLSALSSTAAAADEASGSGQAAVDTSQWKCELCKFEQGVSGTVDVGVGNVSEKSAKFGDYTGLNENGAFFVGDGTLRARTEDGNYWILNASNLGLKSRSLDSEAGQQGKYKLLLKYDELPHTISDNALTPFLGTGGATLTLPAGFVRGTTTDPTSPTGMTSLPGTLQQVELGTLRKRLGVGASWIPVQNWEYAVNFRHETKDGTKRTAGSFFVNSSELVQPIDYSTDQIDASASYTGAKLQAKLAYYGSLFHNNNPALTWQDPFTSVAGESAGQLALPPANQFHQIQASAGYQFSDRTRASAELAFGRMTQNDIFLAPTLTPGLGQPLPGNSLDGSANTRDAGLKLNSAVSERLRLNAAFTYNNRDNKTPQALYPVVSTDMFAATPRTNLPYSFTQDKLKLSADYKLVAQTKASVGFDYDMHKRTYQEAEKTHEDTVWGKITSRAMDKVDLSFKLAHGERTNSGYQLVAGITPTENPLLRKYNMANRTRDTAALRADFAAAENVNVGIGADWSRDKYTDSPIGLYNGSDLNLSGDVTVALAAQTSLHFFANHQEIKSKQFGSQSFATADWTGQNKDTIDLFGLGVKHSMMENKLDLGGDYTFMRSKSDISVDNGQSGPSFPSLSTWLNSLKLYANYQLKDNVSLQAGYWYERYDSRDWMLDGVTPSTIPNVLSLGLQPPQYHVNVVRMSVRYKF
jgi:MtrB/PioB family decaheme-associated outer membrane protein